MRLGSLCLWLVVWVGGCTCVPTEADVATQLTLSASQRVTVRRCPALPACPPCPFPIPGDPP